MNRVRENICVPGNKMTDSPGLFRSCHRPTRRVDLSSDMERPCQGLRSTWLFRRARWRPAKGMTGREAVATMDHSDIRGSKPHNCDSSGAASNWERGLGRKTGPHKRLEDSPFRVPSSCHGLAGCESGQGLCWQNQILPFPRRGTIFGNGDGTNPGRAQGARGQPGRVAPLP